MTLRYQSSNKLRLQTKPLMIYAASVGLISVIIYMVAFNIGAPKVAMAAPSVETMDSGSFIINMGVIPQTKNNALKPYGMVYELVKIYSTPVKWVINDGKVKDGADFTYNAIDYKGGPFIIPAKYITASIKTRITFWTGQGVIGLYTTAPVNVPVYATLLVMPTMTIEDSENKQDIVIWYFDNAMIPSTAYSTGPTSTLSTCHDLWINPHGDPVWATHNRLYNFAIKDGSFVFSQCHATSMMEGCKNTVSPFEQLNFLTNNGLKCYSSGKCGAAITETHGGSPTAPFTYNYAADPIAQFMGPVSSALSGGSEDWYIPQTTGGWRPTTRRIVSTSDGPAGGEGALMVYGPAYGMANSGWVMYQAGHDFGGTSGEDVSAQRAFFNFMLFAASRKSVTFSSDNIPSDFIDNSNYTLTVNVTSGTPPYSYKWSSSLAGLIFDSPFSTSTTFRVPANFGNKSGLIIFEVTDACNRKNFLSRPISIKPNPLPVNLTGFSASANNRNQVDVKWTTASEKNNDYFSIEHSSDGIIFKEIGRTKGAGTINTIKKYHYLDENPIIGLSYYRLKQIDFDGKNETFKTVSVSVKAVSMSAFKVYPNPINTAFTTEFDLGEDQTITMQLSSIDGRVVQTEKIKCTQGFNSFHFELNGNISKGTYVLMLFNEKTVLATQKVGIEG